MAFVKKTWIDRVVQYANRRLLTKSGGEVEQVTVTRDEGTVSVAGDKFDAATMNDLENRIYNADTNMKTYVDGRTPINNGEHATDLSTTGLSTGIYLYNYDGTTNGIPTAGTEGNCFIVINNTQAWGCELAVSNSGLYWRSKQNQVWGNWLDISGKLTVHSDTSLNPIGVNGTYQISANVLGHSLILVSARRQGLGNSAIFTKADLLARDGSFMLASSPTVYCTLKCNTTGLLTVTNITNMNDVYISVSGIL